MDTQTIERAPETISYEHIEVRKLTDDQKVEMVLQKEIRPTQNSTNRNIASEFDVSIGLVSHTNYDTLTDKQKLLYEQRKRKLKYDAQKLTTNAIKKANKLVLMAHSPNHLSSVVAAMSKGHEIGRLEENLSTVNVATIEHKTLELSQIVAQWLSIANEHYTKWPNAERYEKPHYIAKIVSIVSHPENGLTSVDPETIWLEAVRIFQST